MAWPGRPLGEHSPVGNGSDVEGQSGDAVAVRHRVPPAARARADAVPAVAPRGARRRRVPVPGQVVRRLQPAVAAIAGTVVAPPAAGPLGGRRTRRLGPTGAPGLREAAG